MDLVTRSLGKGFEFDFDWALDGAGLEAEDGLQTAVLLSLFTDKRAAPGESLPDGSSDRRGWFGDNLADVEGDRIGSYLWLLDREKQTSAVLQRVRQYAREALQWLIDDDVVLSVEVNAEWVGTGMLGLEVVVTRSDKGISRFQFERFWSQ